MKRCVGMQNWLEWCAVNKDYTVARTSTRSPN